MRQLNRFSSISIVWSLQNFLHDKTVVLSCHVQKMSQSDGQQGCFSKAKCPSNCETNQIVSEIVFSPCMQHVHRFRCHIPTNGRNHFSWHNAPRRAILTVLLYCFIPLGTSWFYIHILQRFITGRGAIGILEQLRKCNNDDNRKVNDTESQEN